jgi:ABC-2 type transport system permease protein
MLHVAVATRAFRRYSTYRAATLAGIFTNSVFGVIYSYAYLALWEQRPHAGGYDATDAVTYVWIGQALLMTVALWGGGTTDELADRIRSGDIAVDLYRPVNLLGWYLAGDLGRAAYHLLTRGLAPTVIGWLLFDIRWPDSPQAAAGVLASILLAVVVSFAVRFLFASSAFWLLDAQGARMLSGVLALFWSGMVLPLVIFPGALKQVALALPWASYLQTPADIWLGQRTGWSLLGGLGLQALWAVVLLGCCQLVLDAATRKVVVQGG